MAYEATKRGTLGPRRVLMICFGFPPTGGPGVQRSAKFARYLPEFGWSPTVWAAEPLEGLPPDPTLLEGLPATVTVHRTPHRLRADRKTNARRTSRWTAAFGELGRALRRAARMRTGRRSWPDEAALWMRASLEPLHRLIARERFDALYSTFSPASNHLLALTLQRVTRLPWVADFRDLWVDDYRYAEPSARRRQRDAGLEAAVLHAADAVVGVTARQTSLLAAKVPLRRHQFATITNGFDPVDFPAPWPGGNNRREDLVVTSQVPFVLAHVGRLDRWRCPAVLFEGLARFAQAVRDESPPVGLHVVGHASPLIRRQLAATGLDCRFTDYVTHPQAIAEMCGADALLLTVPDGPNADSVIPAKAFEYLAARRPVLTIGPPDGECTNLMSRCGAGACVGFESAAIGHALLSLFRARQQAAPWTGTGIEHLERYTRRSLALRLAEVLERACHARGAGKAEDASVEKACRP